MAAKERETRAMRWDLARMMPWGDMIGTCHKGKIGHSEGGHDAKTRDLWEWSCLVDFEATVLRPQRA